MKKRAGIILCGGASSRFGRRKEWLMFDGKTLLARNVSAMAKVANEVIVVAHHSEEVPPLPKSDVPVTVVRDSEPNQGPLLAILTGWAAINPIIDRAIVSACDVPYLLPGFMERMFELSEGWVLTIPSVGGHLYPLSAVYHRDVIETAVDLAKDHRVGPRSLAGKVPTREVTSEELRDVDPNLQSLVSVNTEEDWRAWLGSIQA